jgi:hypothetical protein
METDTVASHATLEALKVFDASPDVFVIITHDSSLLDILEFYPNAELTGWEEGGQCSAKEIGKWGFLKDFRKQVVIPAQVEVKKTLTCTNRGFGPELKVRK